jgi:hypothetical protein
MLEPVHDAGRRRVPNRRTPRKLANGNLAASFYLAQQNELRCG